MRRTARVVKELRRIPRRSAVLTRLAEQEPQLLEPLTKRIFRSHCGLLASVRRMTIGCCRRVRKLRRFNVPPCSSSSRIAPCRIKFSRRANRRQAERNPDVFNFGTGIANTKTCSSSHDTCPLRLTNAPNYTSRERARRRLKRESISKHVVPTRRPHLQQLPALLPTRSRRCPSTSIHHRRPRRLRWLLEQPNWAQDRSLLVCSTCSL